MKGNRFQLHCYSFKMITPQGFSDENLMHFLYWLSSRDFRCLVFLLLLFSLHFAPPNAQNAYAASDTTPLRPNLQGQKGPPVQQSSPQSSLATSDTIRIGYIPQTGEFHRSYNSELYLQQLIQILSKYIPNTFILVPVNVSAHSNVSVFEEFNVNVVALFGKTPQRMLHLKYSKNPITSSDMYLVTNQDNKIFYNDIHTLNGKTVAIYLGNNQSVNSLDEYLVKNNISMKYEVYNEYSEFIKNKAEYSIVNSFYFMKNKQIAAIIGSQDLFFAAPPQNVPLLNLLDKALEQAQKNDKKAMNALYLEHVKKSSRFIGKQLNNTGSNMLAKPRKVAEVAYLADHYPIQYDSTNGAPSGITLDVIKLFQQMHNNPTIFIPYTASTKGDLTKFDMLFSVVGDKELRQKHFYTSKAYVHLPMVFFQKNELSETQEKHHFGMLDYTVLDHAQVQKNFPHWKMNVFADFESMFTAYNEGKIEALFLSSAEAEYAMAQLGVDETTVLPTSSMLPLHFYLSKKYPEMALNILNVFIEKLDPIAVQGAIIKAENDIRAPITVLEFLIEHKVKILGLLAVAILCFAIFYAIKIRHERRKLRKILNTDPLTGLSSKAHLYEVMERVLKDAKPNEYALLSLDIDKFSMLMQVYGKEKGDAILCLAAKTIKDKFSKRQETQCMARMRDDIFVTLVKNHNIRDLGESSDHTLALIYGAKEILESNFAVSLSRSRYVIDDPTLPIETIIDYTHIARRQGKATHGLSFVEFNDEMKYKIQAQKKIIYRMEQALENKEFILHFQPKIDLRAHTVCGAEVLVRWHPPNQDPILPNDFIEVFENNAFITKLDMYVIENTCKIISQYRDTYALPPLAVNLSGITALHADTHAHIKMLLRRYNIAPHELEFEITESALVEESDTLSETIHFLNKLGFKVAIDDFGTGVSSLHRLNSLQVDVVKLDKSFLDDKLAQKRGIILVASLIAMLHRLNIQVVAEGVETKTHALILKKMRCDVAQGYYFSRPINEVDFINKVLQAGSTPPSKKGGELQQSLQPMLGSFASVQ